MLILSRRIGEEIWIDGGRIRITLVGHRCGKTQIGIQAPMEMSVHRREVAEAIAKGNLSAKPSEGQPHQG